MTLVIMLLAGTVVYAGSYVQGWVGAATPTSGTNASCNKTASNTALAPHDVTLNVYNATDKIGLAAAVALALQKQDFTIATVDNDPLGRTIPGVGEIRHGDSGLEGSALAAQRLPGAVLVLDSRMDASVDVVLGNKYKVLTVPPKAAHPKKAKAAPRC